jgi:catechol 2,3-dioxygenase-like lactoylglutathione lyase family enzyme
MFDHVTIRVSDLDASRCFYSLALGEPTHDGNGFLEWGDFGIAAARPERPLTTDCISASPGATDAASTAGGSV